MTEWITRFSSAMGTISIAHLPEGTRAVRASGSTARGYRPWLGAEIASHDYAHPGCVVSSTVLDPVWVQQQPVISAEYDGRRRWNRRLGWLVACVRTLGRCPCVVSTI